MRTNRERLCEITLEVGGYKQEREDEIIRACRVEWFFREDDFFHCPADDGKHIMLHAEALGTLNAGEDEDDYIDRLTRAIWRVNDGMCHVDVQAVCMEQPSVWNPAIEEDEKDLMIA